MLPSNNQDVMMDLEAVLPLSLIRTHTKSDDVPYVTDEQLALYRDSAFDMARRYTGLWLRGQHWETEVVPVGKRLRPVIRHRLQYMPNIEGVVYLYGDLVGNRQIQVGRDACSVEIPTGNDWVSFNTCCDPCAKPEQQMVGYWTGLSFAAEFPAGIRVGMLKYIAFNIMNPGDIGFTYVNDRATYGDRSMVSNDAVVASGAAAEWSRYKRIC